MRTREIPRSEWDQYLSLVSKDEREHLVRVEVLAGEEGDQIVAEHAPLRGLSVDWKDVDPAVEISLGPADASELMHRVPFPSRILVEEDNGQVECIDIESQQSARTLVEFLH